MGRRISCMIRRRCTDWGIDCNGDCWDGGPVLVTKPEVRVGRGRYRACLKAEGNGASRIGGQLVKDDVDAILKGI